MDKDVAKRAEGYVVDEAKPYVGKVARPMNAVRFAKLWRRLCKDCRVVCVGKVKRRELLDLSDFCGGCKVKAERVLYQVGGKQ